MLLIQTSRALLAILVGFVVTSEVACSLQTKQLSTLSQEALENLTRVETVLESKTYRGYLKYFANHNKGLDGSTPFLNLIKLIELCDDVEGNYSALRQMVVGDMLKQLREVRQTGFPEAYKAFGQRLVRETTQSIAEHRIWVRFQEAVENFIVEEN